MMRNSVMMLFTQAALGAATFCYAQQPIPANVPSAVKAKMEQLSSPDPIKRAKAACALGAMEARAVAAIPRLVALLSDGTPIPTQNGCGNAEPFEDESWEPDIAEIHEPSPGEAATHALMAIGEPGVQALQRALLANEFWRARKNAAWGLAHRGDAIDELIAALKDEAWQVRTQAAYALFQRGGDEDRVINALITASRDEVKQVRTQAAFALGHKSSGRVDVVAPLLAALKDEQAEVRMAATGGLWHCAESRDFAPLFAALKDPHAGVRKSVANTLGNRAGDEEVQLLIAARNDPDANVREGVKRALEIVKQRMNGTVTYLRRVTIPD
jgi:HEAT repeat protein